VDRNSQFFKDGFYLTPKDFYRDSERVITLDQIVNLTFENIEEFYDTSSVGQISGETD
jgi:hypothetical protein